MCSSICLALYAAGDCHSQNSVLEPVPSCNDNNESSCFFCWFDNDSVRDWYILREVCVIASAQMVSMVKIAGSNIFLFHRFSISSVANTIPLSVCNAVLDRLSTANS